MAGQVFSRRQVPYLFTFKLTNMSTKFAVIGVVSVLGAGAALHHARYCPLRQMMAALHHKDAKTAVVKAPPAAPASAKVVAATLAMK
jgi:hypothetical protein